MKGLLFFIFCALSFWASAQSNTMTGTWVVRDSGDLDFDNESYARYLKDTLYIKADNTFSIPGKSCCIQWEYDSTEKLFLILDMDKADGIEYMVETLAAGELVFTAIPNARKKIVYRKISL